ncbi:MAG: glycosyltransferase [Actinobacteria bacterium]|nr:glycosyltransferase [Actinomycetota bacterium]
MNTPLDMRFADAAPAVSIVTAAYNASATLAETVESVLAQTDGDWEFVIVDDGSTDATLAIAERFASTDTRVRVISQANAGTAAARNAGVRASHAPWLVMLDSDDLLAPEFISRMSAFRVEHPGFDIYSANGELLLPNGRRMPLVPGAGQDRVHSVAVSEQLWESLVPGTSVARREVFERCGGYRAVYSEDYDFWLRALILGARQIQNPERLWLYRRQAGSKTRALVREAESILAILNDAREMPELTDEERAECDRSIAFAHARVNRRELEEALLDGKYAGARGAYVRARGAFPDRRKYSVGLALMMLSPRLYARVKARRMV